MQNKTVTTIKNPYDGDVPTQKFTAKNVDIDVKSVDVAKQTIDTAQSKSANKKVYEDVFENGGGPRSVPVESMEFKGKPYNVFVGKKVIGKVISDPNMSPEKLAVIDNIDDIITTSKYVGSGIYAPKTTKQRNVVRYGYFESDINTNDKEYTVPFDVEVYPNTNNYRTHQITKIDLTQKSAADVGPVPTATETATSLSTRSISANGGKINTNVEKGQDDFANSAKKALEEAEVKPPKDTIREQMKAENPDPNIAKERAKAISDDEIPDIKQTVTKIQKARG